VIRSRGHRIGGEDGKTARLSLEDHLAEGVGDARKQKMSALA